MRRNVMSGKRMLRFGLVLGTALVSGGVGGQPSWADNKPQTEKPASENGGVTTAEVRVVTVQSAGKHWIGVHAMPITDEALKSQLKLDQRLIVLEVVPDSPAAKSGVQQHDILLKFGDQELKQLEDLIKGVNDNGDRETTLVVLRGGQEKSLKIQPSERPEDVDVVNLTVQAPEDIRVWLEKANIGPHAFQQVAPGQFHLRMAGPGIVAGQAATFVASAGHSFPNGLSLSVTKENDQPAKIVAKKDGKTYETTEDKLDVLPEDIRVQVAKLVATPGFVTAQALHGGHGAVTEEVKKAIDEAKKAANRLKVEGGPVRVRRADGDALEGLRMEIEALRKEVKALQDK